MIAHRPEIYRVAVDRADPPATAPESESVAVWLDWHRATLLTKLDGLTPEQLRWTPVPSGTSLLGLVRHLTDTEHGWFVTEWAGLPEMPPYETKDNEEAAWRADPEVSPESVVSAYLAACERSRALVAGHTMDETVPNARRGRIDLRRIMLHMMEETARHNGHADIIRELIDGATGD